MTNPVATPFISVDVGQVYTMYRTFLLHLKEIYNLPAVGTRVAWCTCDNCNTVRSIITEARSVHEIRDRIPTLQYLEFVTDKFDAIVRVTPIR